MTYQEYLSRALDRSVLNPYERLGQAYFNVLDDVRPDLADQIRGKHPLDPFYDSQIVPYFLEHLQRIW